MLIRYNSDGSLDPGFGTGGKTTTDFSTETGFAGLHLFSAQARALAVQHDGKIIVVGSAANGQGSNIQAMALACYNSDGTPDATFSGEEPVATGGAG